MVWPTRAEFVAAVEGAAVSSAGAGRRVVVPMCVRLMDDQLTPVVAYRRLVAPDERTAASFLLESVEGGERQGRYSILGAQPAVEVIASGRRVRVEDHRSSGRWNPAKGGVGGSGEWEEADPLGVPRRMSAGWRLVVPGSGAEQSVPLPGCVLGGWFGYAGYDSVRYAEPEKLSAAHAPRDDRGLAEMQFAYYDGVVAFDHVEKVVYVVCLVDVSEAEAGERHEIERRYEEGVGAIGRRVAMLQSAGARLVSGTLTGGATGRRVEMASNLSRAEHAAMVARAKEYIAAGDVFQVVLGQRFERRSTADPFDVYRALRAVNPSPYMAYMQAEGCILVGSSPEILCRVRKSAGGGAGAGYVVTNRPLAGTRRRGRTAGEDTALERELLADPKERAEHIMLVDLGRNDVGMVAKAGTIELPALMHIERYSHVMHISSTVTGEVRAGLDCWDALRAALPVGTISGAPKVRAMQIIDELEPVRRGPYGGGFGYVSLDGEMDIALALRTMVVPTAMRDGSRWMYHVQASGGIVADSEAGAEYEETVNKAAALARAIDVAEDAFGGGSGAS